MAKTKDSSPQNGAEQKGTEEVSFEDSFHRLSDMAEKIKQFANGRSD